MIYEQLFRNLFFYKQLCSLLKMGWLAGWTGWLGRLAPPGGDSRAGAPPEVKIRKNTPGDFTSVSIMILSSLKKTSV